MIPTTLPARPVPSAAAGEAERHWNGGLAHARAGRWKEAEKAYARAVRVAPRESLYWVNLAQARRRLGDLEGAAQAVDEALRAAPGDALAAQLRVAIGMERHRYGDAVEAAQALAGRPDATASHWYELGEALYRAGRHPEAVSALLQALVRRPDGFEAYVTLCNAFDRLAMHAEAVECLRTAVALRPGWGPALAGIVYHALYACDWSRLDADLAALRGLLDGPGPYEIGPFMFLSFGADPATQRRVFGDHGRLHFGAVPALPPVAPAALPPRGRLRIGYLSADFQQHATALLLAQVLELHDRERVEVRLYSTGADDGSPMRARLRAAGDAFVDLVGVGDAEAAQRIRDDGVELLVDLKGYTLNARTGIVARRPAPVQAAWLGFPGTMGTDVVDYA
ncbi:MAG TPA: tetratricopeptide repeat protein, partial [Burkholderiaceae bacterium]|nr:tetratricopeptide repeat protein [Burkholderiaceae bacterium]